MSSMNAKNLVVAMLAALGLVATPSAFAELIKVHHYYVGGDDDDDEADDDRYEWKERRDRRKGKKDKDARDDDRYYRHERPASIYMAPETPKPRTELKRSFPRESAADLSAAKQRQRDILEKELAAEQQLLAEAKGRHDDENIRHHERNIEALRRELRNVER